MTTRSRTAHWGGDHAEAVMAIEIVAENDAWPTD